MTVKEAANCKYLRKIPYLHSDSKQSEQKPCLYSCVASIGLVAVVLRWLLEQESEGDEKEMTRKQRENCWLQFVAAKT